MDARFLTPSEEHDLVVQAQAGNAARARLATNKTEHTLTVREEHQLGLLVAMGSAAEARVIDGVVPIIIREARRIANQQNPPFDPDDLAQEAVEKVVEKFARFNADRGTRVVTYFWPAIVKTMLYAVKQNGIVKSVGSPKSTKKATNAARVKHAGPVRSLDVVTLDADGFGLYGDGDGYTAADLLEDPHESVVDEASRDAVVQAVEECILRIPERYQRFIRWRFLEGLTHQEMADRDRQMAERDGRPSRTRARMQQIIVEAMPWVRRILLTSASVREYIDAFGSARRKFPGVVPAKCQRVVLVS